LIIVGLIIFYESFILLKEKDYRNNKFNSKNKNNNIKIIMENNPILYQKSIKQKNSYYNIFLQSIISFFIGYLVD
jgi:Na+/melibiose symporter-like transporter